MELVKIIPIKMHHIEFTREDFPADFIFGTGTAVQLPIRLHEGAATKGGRGVSIWDKFTWITPNRIADGSNGNLAVDMYTKFEEDIMNMKKMGFDAYRFSISWPRVLPGGRRDAGVNKEGIEFYNKVINTLLNNGIEPYVTLFHWDLPQCLQDEYDGFLSKRILKDFREYAELCYWEFGDRVKYWFTVNEPWSYSALGYAQCVFPPSQNPFKSNEESQTEHKISNNVEINKLMHHFSKEALSSGNISNKLHQTELKISNNVEINKLMHHFSKEELSSGGKLHLDKLLLNLSEEHIFDQIDEVAHRVSRSVVSLYKRDNIAAESIGPLGYKTNVVENLGLNMNTVINKIGTHIQNLGYNPSRWYKPGDVYIVARNLLLAHGEAVKSYRTKFQKHQEGKIGITLNCHWHEPYDKMSKEDQDAAIRAVEFMMGWYLEPIMKGKYPDSMIKYVPKYNLAEFSEDEIELIKGSIDFLGLNYYTTYYAKNDPHPEKRPGYMYDQHLKSTPKRGDKLIGPNVEPSWIYVVPEGIYKLLNYVNETYNDDDKLPPIYITENGIDEKYNVKLTVGEACADPRRVEYYQEHLAYLLKAVHEKMNIKGYFAWSYSDNFEWAQGYESRFGIMYIDYKNDNARHPKDSALWFTKFLTKKKNMYTKKRLFCLKVNEDKEHEKRSKLFKNEISD